MSSKLDRLEQLKRQIADLSPSELQQLEATFAYYNRADSTSLSHDEQLILDALREICLNQPWPKNFVRGYGMGKFRERVAELDHIIAGSKRRLHRVQVPGLLLACFRCLAAELREQNVVVSPKVLLDHIALLPNALDQRFPGYLRAGLLHCIVGGAFIAKEEEGAQAGAGRDPASA